MFSLRLASCERKPRLCFIFPFGVSGGSCPPHSIISWWNSQHTAKWASHNCCVTVTGPACDGRDGSRAAVAGRLTSERSASPPQNAHRPVPLLSNSPPMNIPVSCGRIGAAPLNGPSTRRPNRRCGFELMNGRNWENVNLVHRARSIDAERASRKFTRKTPQNA